MKRRTEALNAMSKAYIIDVARLKKTICDQVQVNQLRLPIMRPASLVQWCFMLLSTCCAARYPPFSEHGIWRYHQQGCDPRSRNHVILLVFLLFVSALRSTPAFTRGIAAIVPLFHIGMSLSIYQCASLPVMRVDRRSNNYCSSIPSRTVSTYSIFQRPNKGRTTTWLKPIWMEFPPWISDRRYSCTHLRTHSSEFLPAASAVVQWRYAIRSGATVVQFSVCVAHGVMKVVRQRFFDTLAERRTSIHSDDFRHNERLRKTEEIHYPLTHIASASRLTVRILANCLPPMRIQHGSTAPPPDHLYGSRGSAEVEGSSRKLAA